MGGTLFIRRARDRFSRRVRYLFPGPSCAGCGSHIALVADDLPSTRLALLVDQRYAIPAVPHLAWEGERLHGRYAILREAQRFHGRYAICGSTANLQLSRLF